MGYLRRVIDDELDELFPQVPAIAIDGPKAVGKTTTAEQRVRGMLRLDLRASRTAVEADPDLVRSRDRPLLIDEWQKVPDVWDVVRRVADEHPVGVINTGPHAYRRPDGIAVVPIGLLAP